MLIYILPVSGGGFVSQLAALQHLGEASMLPDICLASSGGNVATYVAMGAQWEWPGIERVARNLNSNMFVSPWSGIGPIATMGAFFGGSMYNTGIGVLSFLESIYTTSTIQEQEVWTGTYMPDKRRSRLFCNRPYGATILDPNTFDLEMTQSIVPILAGGDIPLISIYGLASASIPAVVPPQTIGEDKYIDGGVGAASPLTVVRDSLLSVTDGGNNLHMVYINSIDLGCLPGNDPTTGSSQNILGRWRTATSDMVRSQTTIDRQMAYSMLPSKDRQYLELPCNQESLSWIRKVRESSRTSLLEVYPKDPEDLSITSFDGDKVVELIRSNYGKCNCRLWWSK